MSHCDTRVQIEVKNILSHKIFQIFSKQVFFKFQDYGMSFGKKKFLTKKIALSPSIATRSQRQKLPFACYQRRRNLPVRIAWQGADAWVSHCDTRVQIEVKNILSQGGVQQQKRSCRRENPRMSFVFFVLFCSFLKHLKNRRLGL